MAHSVCRWMCGCALCR